MSLNVTCNADIVLNYSSGTQTVNLSASVNGSANSFRWVLRGVPLNSTAQTGTFGGFVNGVSTSASPSFVTEAGIEGTYVFECTANDGTNTYVSDPEEDQANAQQLVIVKTQTGLKMPGDWQYNWGDMQNTFWTDLEGLYPQSLAEYNAILTDATLDESTDTRPIAQHGIGSDTHTATTLADFNTKISDATLDGSSDSRTPSGSASGDLSGTYPNPTVNKIGGTVIDLTGASNGNNLVFNGILWQPSSYSGSFLALTDTPSSFSGQGQKVLGVNDSENAVVFVSYADLKQNWPTLETAESDKTLVTLNNFPGTGTTLRLVLSDNLMYEATAPLTLDTDTNGLGGMNQSAAGPTYESLAAGLWHIYAVPDTLTGGNAFDVVLSQGDPTVSGPTGGLHAAYKYITTILIDGTPEIVPFKQNDKWSYWQVAPEVVNVNPLTFNSLNTWYPLNGNTLGAGGSSTVDLLSLHPIWANQCIFNVRAHLTTSPKIFHLHFWGGDPPLYSYTSDNLVGCMISLQGFSANSDELRCHTMHCPLVNGMASIRTNRSPGSDVALWIVEDAWYNPMYGV